jgi:hypothetical protein
MPNISVPISTDIFIGLVDFLREKNSPRDPLEVIESAIAYWTDNADWKEEILSPVGVATGYSWKALFLPSGTVLRLRYESEYHYAKIEGDKLVYHGAPIRSPNQFALEVTGGARDAWRDVWIKRPGDEDFVVANSLRSTRT